MRILRTLRTHRPTFLADGSIDLYAPNSWRKMTQTQLHYVLMLLSMFDNLATVKTYMLIRLSGIHIEGYTVRTSHDEPQSYRCWFRPAWWKPRRWFTLQVWQVQSFIRQFDFIDPFDGMDVRLERIHGCRAVDDILDHYPFGDYLMAEQYYQLAVSSADEHLRAVLGDLAYRLGCGLSAEGDFGKREAARDERVRQRQRLLRRVYGDDGNNAKFGDLLEDFMFVWHGCILSVGVVRFRRRGLRRRGRSGRCARGPRT